MALLAATDLEKWYGRVQVVQRVSFAVEPGQIVGLLGPNGAGKTTSFRMTVGLIDADGGSIHFNGRDVTRLAMYQRARAGIGYLPQETSVFRQLSVADNLMAILETMPISASERRLRRDSLLKRFGLEHRRKVKALSISGGEKRRLEIARCLITEPKMIMLDEPFAGIDPITVQEIKLQIQGLARDLGLGILLTDHSVWDVLDVTDHNVVIHQGQVIATGGKRDIVNNKKVRDVYIGQGGGGNPGQQVVEHPAHATPPRPGAAGPQAVAAEEESDVHPVG